jgi:hypothetical protein
MSDGFDRAQHAYDNAMPPDRYCEHGVPADDDCDACYEAEADERDEED